MTPSQKVTYDVLVWVNDISRCPEHRLYLPSDPNSSPGRKQGKNSATPGQNPWNPQDLGVETRKPPR